mmetsp:Transcript_14704/g.17055  ORF Transcript_14704/g.17055 Transcript_14704/m.17055 type:complete len:121 (+) Transcript_14704:318-680(+)
MCCVVSCRGNNKEREREQRTTGGKVLTAGKREEKREHRVRTVLSLYGACHVNIYAVIITHYGDDLLHGLADRGIARIGTLGGPKMVLLGRTQCLITRIGITATDMWAHIITAGGCTGRCR